MLTINRRRVVRWQTQARDGRSLENGKPGPQYPVHRLLPLEKEQILTMAREEEYADMSHRTLTVTAWDTGRFYTSFSSVYRVLLVNDMASSRGSHRPHNGTSVAPVRKELTGPNQRWCWDISYLLTFEKGLYLYLYLLLDEYSRKAIEWMVSWVQSAREAKLLLEGGMVKENILDLPEDERPEVVNDHGRQMKAKPVKRLFEDHHMPQLFARPRTPNDNPFIEASFSTAKRHPAYPGRVLDRERALRYFNGYFDWYNNDHYHSGINYVTPNQAHQGLMDAIVDERTYNLERQQLLRKEENRRTIMGLTEGLKSPILLTGSAAL
jgi:putative transposase